MAEIVQSESWYAFIFIKEFDVKVAITRRVTGGNNGKIHKKSRVPRELNGNSIKKQTFTVILNNDNGYGYWAVALTLFKTSKLEIKEWRLVYKNKAGRLEQKDR